MVQPGECAFDHPAVDPETGAMIGAPLGNEGHDGSFPRLSPVAVVVVAPVPEQAIGAPARAADHTSYRGDQGPGVVAAG
ncbi:MAG: hypothetical protein Kow00122_14050 [Thermoleophilia bacterium]